MCHLCPFSYSCLKDPTSWAFLPISRLPSHCLRTATKIIINVARWRWTACVLDPVVEDWRPQNLPLSMSWGDEARHQTDNFAQGCMRSQLLSSVSWPEQDPGETTICSTSPLGYLNAISLPKLDTSPGFPVSMKSPPGFPGQEPPHNQWPNNPKFLFCFILQIFSEICHLLWISHSYLPNVSRVISHLPEHPKWSDTPSTSLHYSYLFTTLQLEWWLWHANQMSSLSA